MTAPSHAAAARRRHRRWVWLALLIGSLLVWWSRHIDLAAPPPPASAPAADVLSSTDTNATSAPVVASPPSQPSASASALPAAMPAEALARILAENAQPGRLVFLDIALSERGEACVIGAVGTPGHVKPGPEQGGFGWLLVEAFDDDGTLTYRRWVPDPTRERSEFPDSNDPGRIRSHVTTREVGELALRLPGEARPARLVFSRDSPLLTPDGRRREIVGSLVLPSASR